MSSNNDIPIARLSCTDKGVKLRFQEQDANLQLVDTAPLLDGVFAMECTDPKCVSGTQPGVVLPGTLIQEFEIQMSVIPVQVTQGEGNQPCLFSGTNGSRTWIAIFDDGCESLCGEDVCERAKCPGPPCGGLCGKLARWREAAKLPEKTMFYVYKITGTSSELSQLANKLIAVPVVRDGDRLLAAASAAE